MTGYNTIRDHIAKTYEEAKPFMNLVEIFIDCIRRIRKGFYDGEITYPEYEVLWRFTEILDEKAQKVKYGY